MKIGFVSATLADLSLEEVMAFAADAGFGCVELMCWPPGQAERRYAGVTHVDVTSLSEERAGQIRDLSQRTGVAISGLGYYPNILDPDPEHSRRTADHLKKVIDAARRLGVGVVNTFIGRDPSQRLEDSWPRARQVWQDLMRHAEAAGIRVAIENCPMLYSRDEWPGGKNLAVSPAAWNQLFTEVPSQSLGLNFDPSHLIWLQIDYVRAIREFAGRIFHFHAKDTAIDREKLYQGGIHSFGWHRDKLPGLGEVSWGAVFCALTDIGYNGPVCIEMEDRAFEASVKDRQRALVQARRFLEQFVS